MPYSEPEAKAEQEVEVGPCMILVNEARDKITRGRSPGPEDLSRVGRPFGQRQQREKKGVNCKQHEQNPNAPTAREARPDGADRQPDRG